MPLSVPFLMPGRFCKQITPSEPGGACPSHWRRRWNVTQTADWQGGTHWGWGGGWTRWGGEWMERGIVRAKGGGWGDGGEDKKWKDRWCRGQRQGREEVSRSERGERKGRKVGLFFCRMSPGCGSIKSIWGANSCQGLNPISLRGQQKVDKNWSGIEVGSQEDRGAQQWAGGKKAEKAEMLWPCPKCPWHW